MIKKSFLGPDYTASRILLDNLTDEDCCILLKYNHFALFNPDGFYEKTYNLAGLLRRKLQYPNEIRVFLPARLSDLNHRR